MRYPCPRVQVAGEFTTSTYESYVDLAAGSWTHIKIHMSNLSAKLYVNGTEQPAVVVNDLKRPRINGAIALWIGPRTIAHFSDFLTVHSQ